MNGQADVEINPAELEVVAGRNRKVVASGFAWIVRRWAVIFVAFLALLLLFAFFERAAGATTVSWSAGALGIGLPVGALLAWGSPV